MLATSSKKERPKDNSTTAQYFMVVRDSEWKKGEAKAKPILRTPLYQ